MTTPDLSPAPTISSPRPQASVDNEFEFLCALASTNPSPEHRACIANWDLSVLDWTKFTSQAEHHGVLPLAARNLLEISAAKSVSRIPAEIVRELQSAYETNLRRNLWFASEMLRILQQLDSKQLPAIPYKGPVLAQVAYGDLALRRFSDLDFLISPADFHRAKQALAEIGYHPSTDLTPEIERFWLRKGNERMFDGPAGKNLVELQWAILPRFYAVDVAQTDLAVENLIARARRTTVAEREVPRLSPKTPCSSSACTPPNISGCASSGSPTSPKLCGPKRTDRSTTRKCSHAPAPWASLEFSAVSFWLDKKSTA